MKNTRKLAGHAFVLLVIEKTNETFGKVTFRWCPTCGMVLPSFKPQLGQSPTYMVPEEMKTSRWSQSPPVCSSRHCNWESAS